jgi:urease accessory protein
MMGLLLLADSRLPAGGHGHSGGVEALVDRGLLRTEQDLAAFVAGRLRTGGAVPAAAAAAACALAPSPEPGWRRWEAAVSARIPAAPTRAASWAQGAALLRTVAIAWPSPAVDAVRALPRVHHPLVLGVAAAASGATPADAAALALHHLVGGACTAAVRLLGLDPLRVAALAAAAGRDAEPVAVAAAEVAAAAVAAADPSLLPTEGSPLTDVFAELHHRSEATLFAS